jgi:endonuclease G, mitochondrial
MSDSPQPPGRINKRMREVRAKASALNVARKDLTRDLRLATPTLSRTARVTDVISKLGLEAGDWKREVLLHSANDRGRISEARARDYFYSPADGKFVSSAALSAIRFQLPESPDEAFPIAKLREPWQRELCRRAAPKGSETVTLAQWEKVADQIKSRGGDGQTMWLPDQQVSMLRAQVASLMMGAKNNLNIDPRSPKGLTTLPKEFMNITIDDWTKAPIVSYVLTAADIIETPVNVKRRDNFHDDETYELTPEKEDFLHTGKDKGHQRPAEDSPNMDAMDESFIMTNMGAQWAELNQASWRRLEEAVNELVRASGGKGTIKTGGLFIDDKGKPLTPDQIKKLEWIGKGDADKIAVPTHFFKTVVLKDANGRTSPMAWIVPNKADMPLTLQEIVPLLNQCKVSIDSIQKLVKTNLYPDADRSLKRRFKSAEQDILFPHADFYDMAARLWPQDPARPYVIPDRISKETENRLYNHLWDD